MCSVQGAVDEVPGAQPPLLPLDQEKALARKHQEVLLGLLSVVQGVRLARPQDPQPEAQLGEPCVRALE